MIKRPDREINRRIGVIGDFPNTVASSWGPLIQKSVRVLLTSTKTFVQSPNNVCGPLPSPPTVLCYPSVLMVMMSPWSSVVI